MGEDENYKLVSEIKTLKESVLRRNNHIKSLTGENHELKAHIANLTETVNTLSANINKLTKQNEEILKKISKSDAHSDVNLSAAGKKRNYASDFPALRNPKKPKSVNVVSGNITSDIKTKTSATTTTNEMEVEVNAEDGNTKKADSEVNDGDDKINDVKDNCNEDENENNEGEKEKPDEFEVEHVTNPWTEVNYKAKMDKSIQPIQVTVGKENFTALYQTLKRKFDLRLFKIQQMNGNGSARIHLFTEEIRERIINHLALNEHEFHSFTAKNNKKKCFILRGLIGYHSVDVIKMKLVDVGFPNETEVYEYITGFMRANVDDQHSKLYRIITPADFDEGKMKSIDSMFGLQVKFENFKSSKIIQCKNCQSFFHTSGQCYRKYRCVKCDRDHGPGDCPRNLDKSIPLRCVNCGGAHSANSFGECKYVQERVIPVLKKKFAVSSTGSGKTTIANKQPRVVNAKFSFATVVGGNDKNTAAKPSNNNTGVQSNGSSKGSKNRSLENKIDKLADSISQQNQIIIKLLERFNHA